MMKNYCHCAQGLAKVSELLMKKCSKSYSNIVYFSRCLDVHKKSLEELSTAAATILGKDGTRWQQMQTGVSGAGRFSSQNVLRRRPGPTAFAAARVEQGNPVSAFRVIFSESMVRHICKCTTEEGRRVKGSHSQWQVNPSEMDRFLGLWIARGVIGGRSLPLRNFWSHEWGNPMFPKTMSRERFMEIKRFLRFDQKCSRRERFQTDKFCLVSDLWNAFIENSQLAYYPQAEITVDEQLLPCKARCKFIQYMSKKPDKFGIKFWLLVDLETKYLINGFPYLGKDEERGNLPVSTAVVLRLVEKFTGNGHNVTSDNYFTNLTLAKALLRSNISILGTVRLNRRELPAACSQHVELHQTRCFQEKECGASLTVYQCKKKKTVAILSTLHRTVFVPEANNPKQKPDTVLHYNKSKIGVDMLDKMVRQYSVKAASRRWPIHVFSNILDISLLNAWVIYRGVTSESISRREFIQKVVESLIEKCSNEIKRTNNALAAGAGADDVLPKKKERLTCVTKLCKRNRTQNKCRKCNQPLCGKCAVSVCPTCT